jgi:hypothetical protein
MEQLELASQFLNMLLSFLHNVFLNGKNKEDGGVVLRCPGGNLIGG